MTQQEYLESPLFWLKRAYLAARKALDEGLQEHNLTSAQFEVFRQALREDGIEQRTLQERLQVSSATVTGIVDGLVSRNLVQRVQHVTDARVKRLYVTPQGRELAAALRRKAAAVEELLLQGFSPAERALLREWLQRMAENAGAAGEDIYHRFS